MSQDIEPLPALDTRQDPASRPYFILPGCGLAAYVVVLFSFFVIGMTGLALWTLTIFSAEDGARIDNLTYGGHVPAAAVIPMFSAGLLKPGEIPDLFHVEAANGSIACAVVSGDIVRISATEKIRFPLKEIREIQGDEEHIVVVGPQTFACEFALGTGGDRFRRILVGESSVEEGGL
jgi:hypothetical protein